MSTTLEQAMRRFPAGETRTRETTTDPVRQNTQPAVSRRDLWRFVYQLNTLASSTSTQLLFKVQTVGRRLVVDAVDLCSGATVRQIPKEEMPEIFRRMSALLEHAKVGGRSMQ